MKSLNILKQELINQKALLEQKGFSVSTQHTNPSPSEITSAIENINLDFSSATATETDVSLGKTFYAQSGELKTGTLDVQELNFLSKFALPMITGEGSVEIYIPTDSKYTLLKHYAYSSADTGNSNLFYKHNLTIPSNIKTIGIRSFQGSNLTGSVTVPSTCTFIWTGAFQETNISEITLSDGLISNSQSGYICAGCPNLVKATLLEPISTLPSYTFSECTALSEVYLPSTLTSLASTCFSKCTNINIVKFTGSSAPTCASATFKQANLASLLVPYQYYNTYYTASNYLVNGNSMYGYGEFTTGQSLPSSISGYSITWYQTLENAKSSTSPITSCPSSGTMYGVFSAS